MRLLLALLVFLCVVPDARAQEYRRITLADGRALVAEVEQTLPDGLVVLIPQGKTKVPFTAVRNLEPVDAAAYRAQPSWGVVVLPLTVGDPSLNDEAGRIRDQLVTLLGVLPAVQPALSEARPVAPGRKPNTACGLDLSCIGTAGTALGATVAISGELNKTAAGLELKLASVFVGTPDANASRTVTSPPPMSRARADLFDAASSLLLLIPDRGRLPPETVAAPEASPWGDSAPATPVQTPVATGPATPLTTTPATPAQPKAPKEPKQPASADRVRALAWVPVPGLPSMARHDGKGAALSWAIAVPSAAALVNLAGNASFTQPQFLATSAVATLSTVIAVNHAIGLRGLNAVVTPIPGGAAAAVELKR